MEIASIFQTVQCTDSTLLAALANELNRIQMSLNELAKKRKDLSDYLTLLNNYHNSLLPINKTIPDILYRIFALAVFGSTLPGRTALIISHVCHHWRKSALEWPILWGFWDYNSRRISELFLKRSRDVPITLSWARSPSHHPLFKRFRMANSRKKRSKHFELCASVLPRLDTLIISIPFKDFNEALPVFQSSEQLQLRSIDIGLRCPTEVLQTGINTKWFECLSTDSAYLRELVIRGLSLPWTIPPHQNLTRLLILTPSPLPTPVDLLTFLSHCPALNELEICLSLNSHTDDVPFTILPVTFQKLNFSYLTRLSLSATDTRSYECVREVSSRIVIPVQLSSLSITYLSEMNVSSTKLFELAPTGSLAHFKNQPFFSINFPLPSQPFHIHAGSDPNCLPRAWTPSSSGSRRNNSRLTKKFPLSLVGWREEVLDHSPVIDLIRGMSNIRHLQLISFAWELLTSWNVDFPVLFPHLTTLELCDQYRLAGDCTSCLTALVSFPDITLNTLILRGVSINPIVLLDVASKIGLRTLELEETHIESEILTILRGKGVEVILADEKWYCTVSGD